MRIHGLPTFTTLLLASLWLGCGHDRDLAGQGHDEVEGKPARVRVMTFNLEDIRTADLAPTRSADHPRLLAAARLIQALRPDILLLQEMAYDAPGAPGYFGAPAGTNGQRFADRYLAVSQAGRPPLRYRALMAPSNTGLPSGFDLDNNGRVVTAYPAPLESGPRGEPGAQTAAGRAYGNDAYGFGTFPGQYAMALLVREGLSVERDEIRTFQRLRWSAMPGAIRPPIQSRAGEVGPQWYSNTEWRALRLSSKTHWDVPVELPNEGVLHVLMSHPTPPVFDGPEGRNKARNHDEIRFWADYIDDREYIRDDQGEDEGLDEDAHFVIVGDLNADPDEGAAFRNPIERFLLSHPRVQGWVEPLASRQGAAWYPSLDASDTSHFGLRVDYALPSTSLSVLATGMVRANPAAQKVSDHFPVWVDLLVPGDDEDELDNDDSDSDEGDCEEDRRPDDDD